MTDTFVPPTSLPTLVETVDNRIHASMDIITNYEIAPLIDFDEVARYEDEDAIEGDNIFIFDDDDLLIDYLISDIVTVPLSYGDPRNHHDDIVTRIITAAVDSEHDYADHHFLFLTLRDQGPPTINICLDSWRAVALASNEDSDHAAVEAFDSLLTASHVNLASLARRLQPEVARAVAEALIDLNVVE